MADFKTHASFGIALGILGVIGTVTAAIADGPGILVALFAAATLGSVLPDIDSDSGVPFHVTFGSLSLVSGALVFLSFSKDPSIGWQGAALRALGVTAFVWIVVGAIFRRFTRHRGMAHSIPGALLSGLATFFLASRYSFGDADAFLLGTAITAGYLVHLILDELWAAVNFHGKPFHPNAALGSALKLFSDSMPVNVAVYGAILFLLAGNVTRFVSLATSLWGSVR
ncbi:MAG TPA: metal-dependent hydrolase [Candidatus Fimivivens sp.]|nr:metal-dependent hydrolase [Candidatus Fimivivens sp.]